MHATIVRDRPVLSLSPNPRMCACTEVSVAVEATRASIAYRLNLAIGAFAIRGKQDLFGALVRVPRRGAGHGPPSPANREPLGPAA